MAQYSPNGVKWATWIDFSKMAQYNPNGAKQPTWRQITTSDNTVEMEEKGAIEKRDQVFKTDFQIYVVMILPAKDYMRSSLASQSKKRERKEQRLIYLETERSGYIKSKELEMLLLQNLISSLFPQNKEGTTF